MHNGQFMRAVSDCEISVSEIRGRRPGSLCAEAGSHNSTQGSVSWLSTKQLGRSKGITDVTGSADGFTSVETAPGFVKTSGCRERVELFSRLSSPAVLARAFVFHIDESETNFLSEISVSEFSHSQDPKMG
jgi:hypothetical protein